MLRCPEGAKLPARDPLLPGTCLQPGLPKRHPQLPGRCLRPASPPEVLRPAEPPSQPPVSSMHMHPAAAAPSPAESAVSLLTAVTFPSGYFCWATALHMQCEWISYHAALRCCGSIGGQAQASYLQICGWPSAQCLTHLGAAHNPLLSWSSFLPRVGATPSELQAKPCLPCPTDASSWAM